MKYATPVHRRDIIRGVRKRWLDQYKHYANDDPLGWKKDHTAGQIRKALAALDLETCSVADVDKAIGTTGWADNKCNECDKNFPVILQLGQTPEYEARWWNICLSCLNKAGKLLKATKPHR